MPTIIVRLEDILTSPKNPVDLASLPAEEAVAHVRQVYDFLPDTADISIADGVVTIVVPDASAERAGQALQNHQRAVRMAKRGRYQSAIKLFQGVLEVLPNHLDARRNLAMAHMEMGNSAAAKQCLLQVLQIDPRDTQALLIMGNLYAQAEQDPETAERFYKASYQIDPDDSYLLSSYGGILAKQGQFEQAGKLLKRAIKIEPDYPNPRYGLALIYAEQGDAQSALVALDELFARPQPQDVRRDPVYEQARELYLSASQRLARDQSQDMMSQLEEVMDSFASQTGYLIHVVRDETIDLPAKTQLAWVHGRSHHTIRYGPTNPATVPHLVAHEFEHIRLANQARDADRSKLFTTNDRTEQVVMRYVSSSVSKLQRRGLGKQAIDGYIEQIIHGISNQLFNIPVDMFIEHRIYHGEPFLRPSQLTSLHTTHLEAAQAITDDSVRELTPTRIYQANTAMSCAFALATDALFGGATDYAGPYRSTRAFSTGRRLYQAWEKAVSRFEPGDEYDLVDEFARILKLDGWYEWKPDDQDGTPAVAEPDFEGSTDPELLEEKSQAAVMYCLSALQRFGDMIDSHVFQIVSEIALLGRSGLDYASAEKKYTLQSLPDEQFSGLQLMCMMHVGFKRVDPSVDPGTGLDDAYLKALEMHGSQ
ncbi:MAG: tetratricopeptide repeat protein [Planctomycetota bacterium]|jgi:tetratricopeptide (TPR) repeat protein